MVCLVLFVRVGSFGLVRSNEFIRVGLLWFSSFGMICSGRSVRVGSFGCFVRVGEFGLVTLGRLAWFGWFVWVG